MRKPLGKNRILAELGGDRHSVEAHEAVLSGDANLNRRVMQTLEKAQERRKGLILSNMAALQDNSRMEAGAGR